MKAAQLAQNSIEVTWCIGSFLAYGASVLSMAILLLRETSIEMGELGGHNWWVGGIHLGHSICPDFHTPIRRDDPSVRQYCPFTGVAYRTIDLPYEIRRGALPRLGMS